MSSLPRLRTIELNAHLHKPTYRSRSLLYQNTYSLLITQTRTCCNGILKMELGTIICSQCHGKATLCIASVAFTKFSFSKQRYPNMLLKTQIHLESRHAPRNYL